MLTHTVKSGESISTIFSDFDLGKTDLHKIIHANQLGEQFAAIAPGKKLYLTINPNGQLQQLIYHKNSSEAIQAKRITDKFSITVITEPLSIDPLIATTTITHLVKSGETISAIFSNFDLSKFDLLNVINANELGKQFSSISPGKKLYLTLDSNGQLQQLIYLKSPTEVLKAKRLTDTFSVELIDPPLILETSQQPTPFNTNIKNNSRTTNLSDTESSQPIETSQSNVYKTLTHLVKKGESISSIFSVLDLSKLDLHNVTHSNELGKQFASIAPEKSLYITTNTNGQLQKLIYHKNLIDTLIAKRINDTFVVELISKPIKKTISNTQVIINNSLFLDGQEAGLSDKLIMQLADIFAWDIDFALNIRKGDQFTAIYEKVFVDNKEIDNGNILAAEFINQGRSYTAVRFEQKEDSAEYFTPNGKSMHKTFLRTPVEFARISSRFNLKRKHPVLNRIRAHKGVDYAAKSGTPIKTTGNGKITFRGRKGGYGRVVIVQHGQKYSSLYAHMSGFRKGQRVGSTVKQGQIIGYVGKSGLATGAHLHYEFRVNGVHRNPLTVKLPKAKSIKKSLLAQFKKQTQPFLTRLNSAKKQLLVVQNKP
jgi:murein DD-endopeptidase MepM/ murein hydrolase activator NlpD